AGIAQVYYAVADPNPAAAGGADVLAQAGVRVHGPLEPATDPDGPAHRLVRFWLASVRRGRPFVTLKTASTLDGRIAAADGSSRWITGPRARAHAHAVRADVDAIAVGTGTLLTDDPSLTARPGGAPSRPGPAVGVHQPLRVVVGRRNLPEHARVRGEGGALVHLRTHDPAQVLAELAALEVRHLLVEGGPTLAAAFWHAGLVDEVHAYLAPVLLGAGPAVVGDLGIRSIDRALRLTPHEVRTLGDDVLMIAVPTDRAPQPVPAPSEQES
ncbi:MAG: bifunctional diaminohydroxyphosphoribosylaminopyrimidine deaminase/5-amino-6-(5-phosphoribosylamino)uracil reductase RibD, partial [Cellulomonadaceae bacterium]